MLKRINNSYTLEEGVGLTEEQLKRFEEIKSLPAGFMPDYEAYILEGSMPSEFDEEGNKRNLAVHPMRDLMINASQGRQDDEIDMLCEALEEAIE